jgi:hypothetical protein
MPFQGKEIVQIIMNQNSKYNLLHNEAICVRDEKSIKQEVHFVEVKKGKIYT